MAIANNGNNMSVLSIEDKLKKLQVIPSCKSQFEMKNIDVCNILAKFYHPDVKDTEIFWNFSYQRPGQDLRYSLDDSKLRKIGWKEEAVFEKEIIRIAEYYKGKFIW